MLQKVSLLRHRFPIQGHAICDLRFLFGAQALHSTCRGGQHPLCHGDGAAVSALQSSSLRFHCMERAWCSAFTQLRPDSDHVMATSTRPREEAEEENPEFWAPRARERDPPQPSCVGQRPRTTSSSSTTAASAEQEAAAPAAALPEDTARAIPSAPHWIISVACADGQGGYRNLRARRRG